ncbi:hypothetical protein [Nocardia stercoris]|nr:hypothetical protein [Nocardia stercoris]
MAVGTDAQGTTDGQPIDPNAAGPLPVDPAQAAALYAAAAASATGPTATDAELGDTGLPSASDLLNPPAQTASIDGKQHFWNVPQLFTPPGASPRLKAYIVNVDKAIQIAVDLLGLGVCEAPPTPAQLDLPPGMEYVDSSAVSKGYTAVSARSRATADSLVAAHEQIVKVTDAAADGKGQALIRIQDVVSVLQSLLHSVAAIPKLSAPDETQLMKILGEAVTAIYDKIQKVATDNQTMAGTGTTDGTGGTTGGTGGTTGGTGGTDSGTGATDVSAGTSAGGGSGLSGMLPLLPMLAMPIEQVIQSVLPALQGKDGKDGKPAKPGDPQQPGVQATDPQIQPFLGMQTITQPVDHAQIVDGSQVAPATATVAAPAGTVAPVSDQSGTQQSTDQSPPASSVLL